MAKNDSILEKGPYLHNRSGAFIEVKNFILAEKSGKRYLLLQLVNKSEVEVSSIKFSLVQLDAAGNVIAKNSYRYNVKMEYEKDFALESGLVIKDECVDFRIQMIYAVSGDYKYFFRNGESVQSYDPRGYSEKRFASGTQELIVRRRYARSGALNGFIAALSAVAALLACAFSAIVYFI